MAADRNQPGGGDQGPQARVERALPRIWRRLLLLFLLVTLAIAGTSYAIFWYQQRFVTDEAFRRIEGVQTQVLNHLTIWERDREETFRRIADDPRYNRLLADLDRADFAAARWQPLLNEFRDLLRRPRYLSVLLFDPNGRLRLHLGEPAVPGEQVGDLARRAATQGSVLFDDNARAAPNPNAVRILQFAPVRRAGRVVAVIGFRLDPHYYMEAVVTVWPETASSGEVLLVRLDGGRVYYFNPRRRANAGDSVDAGRPGLLAAQLGARLEGYDYSGTAVFGAVAAVPNSPWRLVTKVDQAEVFANVRRLAVWITGVALALVGLAGGLLSVWWRKERADADAARYRELLTRQALERHYDYLSRYANDAIILADEHRIVEANERALQLYGYDRDELLRMEPSELRAPADREAARRQLRELVSRGADIYETTHRTKEGREVPVEVSARVIDVERHAFRQFIVRDISERRRAEARIERLKDLYAVLSQVDAALIRSRDREVLFREIVRIAVEYGHFLAAWIVVRDPQSELTPVAVHGQWEPQMIAQRLRESREFVDQVGPVATALNTGQVTISNDLLSEPGLAEWQSRLRTMGARACAALPIKVGDTVIGVLAVDAGEANTFDQEMTNLLNEMSADVSFALETFEREAQRAAAERAQREAQARYQQLFDNMNSAVVVFRAVDDGADFELVDANRATEAIEQVERAAILGRRASQYVGDEAAPIREALGRVYRTGAALHLDPTVLRAMPGRWREFWIYALPNRDVVALYDDVTGRMEAQEALRRSEERLALVLKGINDGYWDFNFDTGEAYYSQRFAELFGYRPEELDHSLNGWRLLVYPEDLPRVEQALEDNLAGRTPQLQLEHRMVRKDGSVIWVLVRGGVVRRDAAGRPLRMAGAHTDITEQKRYENQLTQWATVFGNSGEAIFITDAQQRIVSANPAFSAITGYTEAEVLGTKPHILDEAHQDRDFFRNLVAELSETGHWQGEFLDRRKNGETFSLWAAITATTDHRGRVQNYIGICSDISARKAAEARIHYLAHHDALTGLPNRALLQDRLTQALAHVQRTNSRAAVLFIDLDHFKNINDSLGHQVGDELLKVVAERLRNCVRMDDTVSRQGGDEFLMVLTDLREVSDAAHVAQKAIDMVSQPALVGGSEIHITPSIGIAVAPEDGIDGDTLIRNADTAMYYAKERGRNNYQFFIAELNRRARERITTENNLRRAVDHGDFVLHYQPKIDTRTEKLVGAEALVRWQRKGRLVPPGEFIHVAEDTGLIIPIGEWVLREACRQQHEWSDDGLPPIPLAINISAVQFRKREVLSLLRNLIASICPHPELLEMELTESTIMEDAESSVQALRALKEMGVQVAIDDFGTGYSSLSYLRRFPIDRLKVDQSFVHDLTTDPADRAITESIIALAKSLHIRVIAEGVEQPQEVALLRKLHCDELQGFYYAPPLPPAEFVAWRRGRNGGEPIQ